MLEEARILLFIVMEDSLWSYVMFTISDLMKNRKISLIAVLNSHGPQCRASAKMR
jgi:hypothetical protein